MLAARSLRAKKKGLRNLRLKWWYHLEHLEPDRFKLVRNGSSSLAAALLTTAAELRERGDWSRAVEYLRLSRKRIEFEPDSYVTIRGESAPPVNPAGRRGWRRIDDARISQADKVEEIVFYATGTVGRTDRRLLPHLRRQLEGGETFGVHAQLWLLLFVMPSFDESQSSSASNLGPAFLWSERALQQELPALAAAFNRSVLTLTTENDQNHARYYYFHTSLLLWHRVCGHDYPRLRYVWRIEPDVVYSGSLAMLLRLSARTVADLLLPVYWSRDDTTRKYIHWNITERSGQLSRVPVAKRVWSLVSISRLSTRFLTQWLARGWSADGSAASSVPEAGERQLVYEEIAMPLSCVMSDGCVLAGHHAKSCRVLLTRHQGWDGPRLRSACGVLTAEFPTAFGHPG